MKYVRCTMLALMVLTLSCMVIAVTGNIARASVGGQCSDCHTMHYSQGATTPSGAGPDGPYETLLLDDCIGCHTAPTADPLDNTYNTPFVNGSGLNQTANDCLAGGYFTSGGDSHDDASHTLTSTASPAGYTSTWYNGTSAGFSCAGATGCHGDQQTSGNDMLAIKGGHHDTSKAYRMLYVGGTNTTGGTTQPVDGNGAADYEEALIDTATINTNASLLAHNVYSAGSGDVTISELCGKCHGDFHQDIGTASPWVRHPTDVEIPSTWDIRANFSGNYTDADRKYNPLGFDGAVEAAGDAKATCLSCHRAHGSDVDDILRFPYDSQIAGGGNYTGCLGCHDAQR